MKPRPPRCSPLPDASSRGAFRLALTRCPVAQAIQKSQRSRRDLRSVAERKTPRPNPRLPNARIGRVATACRVVTSTDCSIRDGAAMLPVIEPLLLADTSGRARSCWAWLHLVRSRALSPDRSRELARRRWKLGHCRLLIRRPYVKASSCVRPVYVIVSGGAWASWVGRIVCARAPMLTSVLDPRVGSGAGDKMLMGCCSRWGKRCGRSIFLGRPRERVGSDSSGAGRGASV